MRRRCGQEGGSPGGIGRRKMHEQPSCRIRLRTMRYSEMMRKRGFPAVGAIPAPGRSGFLTVEYQNPDIDRYQRT